MFLTGIYLGKNISGYSSTHYKIQRMERKIDKRQDYKYWWRNGYPDLEKLGRVAWDANIKCIEAAIYIYKQYLPEGEYEVHINISVGRVRCGILKRIVGNRIPYKSRLKNSFRYMHCWVRMNSNCKIFTVTKHDTNRKITVVGSKLAFGPVVNYKCLEAAIYICKQYLPESEYYVDIKLSAVSGKKDRKKGFIRDSYSFTSRLSGSHYSIQTLRQIGSYHQTFTVTKYDTVPKITTRNGVSVRFMRGFLQRMVTRR